MSRDVYFLWKDSGSPRQGELIDMKNRAKARFKGAMRFIRSHEDSLRKYSLAKHFYVKMINNSGRRLNACIAKYLFKM